MAKDDLYAFHGVILKCDKGATVLPLLATPKKHAVSGLQIATVTDNIPIVNIPSFGVCSITGNPCVPVAPQWLKEHDGAQKVMGNAPLLLTSYCKCQAGGTIEIFASVEDAQAALEEDKKSRVDGIPWLDGALGTALLGPIGPVLDMFTDGDHDITEGVGRGSRQSLKGTWNGLVQMATHPRETAKGLTKMGGIAVVAYGGPIPTPSYTPEQRLKDFDKIFGTDLAPTHNAIGEAIVDSWDKKVVNGTTEERSEVVGEVYAGVLEVVVGTKGAGLAVKGVTTAGKFVLGAEKVAAITAKIAKLQTAMKLIPGKVRGIFKVGAKKKYIDGIEKFSLSNVDARKWYLQKEADIPKLINKNLSLEEQAKHAFELRNKFRKEARELMSDRKLADELNINEKNMTWEEIIEKTKNKGYEGDEVYNEIINSSQRSRKSVNENLGIDQNQINRNE